MSSQAPSKVLIFGTGAIGSIYAFVLSRAGCHITAVCRSNYTAVSSNGIKISSPVFGSHTFKPDVVASSVPEGKYDFIVVTSKSFPLSDPASPLVPGLTPGHTAIVLIQNGIGIESPYREKFPDNPILSCVVYLPVTQTSPGIVVHREDERLLIGTYPHTAPQSHKEKTELFASFIKEGGATIAVFDDVQGERWIKLLINASWNPICALTRSRDAEFLTSYSAEVYEPALDVAEGIMKEISMLAIASGYRGVNEMTISLLVGKVKARITGKENQGVEVSMLGDVLNSRQMEVDALVGNAVKAAEQLGLGDRIPMLRMLWVLAAALDKSPRR